jgi:hypothetical protein
MRYNDFIKLLEKHTLAGTLPKMTEWPDEIELSTEFKNMNVQLFQKTDISGYEHEVSVFYVDGDVLASSVLKGDKNQVKVNHSVNLSYIPQKNGNYQKEIYIDSKLVKKASVKSVPAKQVIKYLLNIHTHPKFTDLAGKDSYSFFSVVDVEGFIGAAYPVIGVITSKLWLACKTDKSVKKIGSVGEEMVYFVTEGMYKGKGNMEELVLKEMKNWGLVFYSGELNGNLYRVN